MSQIGIARTIADFVTRTVLILMSSPDSGQPRPDSPPNAWPQPPLAADPAIDAVLSTGAGAAIWSVADGKPLWWNELGAAVFGLPGDNKAVDIGPALARVMRSDRPWLERRRLSSGRRPCLATLQFSRVALDDGAEALLALAVQLEPPIAVSGRELPPPPGQSHRRSRAARSPRSRSATARPESPPWRGPKRRPPLLSPIAA